MINKRDICIVVPIYQKSLRQGENISINQLDKYLSGFDRYFIAPKSLVKGAINRKGYRVVRFDDQYFDSRDQYNKLLLRRDFYKAFKRYKYMLIYQLDALVFSSDLVKWCRKGYDYVASPWLNTRIGYLTNKKGSPVSGGNGGLSLRNIQKSLEVLDIVEKTATRTSNNRIIQKIWLFQAILSGESHGRWLNAPADNYPYNEDGFWSLEAPKYISDYKIAPFDKALKFAFEKFPGKCFKLNHHKLPFGVHAWEKYDKEFWLPYIK